MEKERIKKKQFERFIEEIEDNMYGGVDGISKINALDLYVSLIKVFGWEFLKN